jgi:RimJ/RimL family protein N-acetyltransferase
MATSSEIRTKRLRIIPFNENHLQQKYVGWLNDAELMRYSEQRHKKHDIENCRIYLKSFEGTANFFWAIEEIEVGYGHIGNITAYVNEKNLLADVGIMIGAKEARNKHYGIEAWMGVCNYLFNNVPIRKMTAGTISLNIPMLKIMDATGMIEDGIRKKQFLVEGQEVDIIHKALFREQWRMLNSSKVDPLVKTDIH